MRTLAILAICATSCSTEDADKFPDSPLEGGESDEGDVGDLSEGGDEEDPIGGDLGGDADGEGEGEGEGEDEIPCECVVDEDCQDENACNGSETCNDCTCIPAAPLDCTDELPCTENQCSPESGCIITAVHARCSEGEICSLIEGCVAPPPCADDNDCSVEDACQTATCDGSSRTCIFAPLDGDNDEFLPRVCGGQDCDDGNHLINPNGTEICNEKDDDCDGMVDEGYNLLTDRQNCGTCSTQCNDSVQCVDGTCSACDTPNVLLLCDGENGPFCADFYNDRLNCGACGNVCPDDLPCSAGRCWCHNASLVLCGDSCVSTRTDDDNCGECDIQCPLGHECSEGICQCAQDQDGRRCLGQCLVCNDQCTVQDQDNCGECGNTCPNGSQCVNGECVCETYFDYVTDQEQPCNEDCIVCDEQCINPANDPLNCRECGNSCGGTACIHGRCVCPARTPDSCDGQCVDTQTDYEHCGECGNACGPLEDCIDGECECYYLQCDGECIHPYDPLNCGECGNNCVNREGVWGCSPVFGDDDLGACVRCGDDPDLIVCPDARARFGRLCTDPEYDPLHCGACGNECQENQVCDLRECQL